MVELLSNESENCCPHKDTCRRYDIAMEMSLTHITGDMCLAKSDCYGCSDYNQAETDRVSFFPHHSSVGGLL
jgi:hypothetical protein